MADRKPGRLGYDPLAKQPRGIDGIIRDTRTDAETPTAPTTSAHPDTGEPTASTSPLDKVPGMRGAAGRELPRLTIAFTEENVRYLRLMAAFDGVTITRYIHGMIEKDKERNRITYDKIRAIIDGGKE